MFGIKKYISDYVNRYLELIQSEIRDNKKEIMRLNKLDLHDRRFREIEIDIKQIYSRISGLSDSIVRKSEEGLDVIEKITNIDRKISCDHHFIGSYWEDADNPNNMKLICGKCALRFEVDKYTARIIFKQQKNKQIKIKEAEIKDLQSRDD